MPESIADQFADQFTFRDLQLNRLAESERRKVWSLLKDVEIGLSDALRDINPSGPTRSAFRQKRLEKLMEAVQKNLTAGYRNIAKGQTDALRDVAVMEAGHTATIAQNTIGVDLLNISPTAETLSALVDDTLIEGATVQDWWKRQLAPTRDRFRDEMRKGLFLNESNNDLMRRVRGTREKRFADGILGINRKNAERIVRTSINSVSNAARESVFKANDDVVRGMQALATLDLRTSDICKARSGSAWDVNTGKALPESPRQEPYPGKPPWHWRCRTTLIAVLKSFEELFGAKGKAMDDRLKKIGPGTQASMDGQVAGGQTFEGWLSKQSAERQLESLGPGRRKLWKEGKISFTDLIDQKGRPLTLEQLREVS